MRNYKQLAIPDTVWTKPSHFVAFGFGSGTMPFAPGTFGTLMAIPFYLVLSLLPNFYYFIVLLFIIAGSMWLCDKVSQEIKIHDHPGMCIDEFIGLFVALYGAPRGLWPIILGVLLFRLFDIWKPWPINVLDKKVKGGFGMIIDDVVAGIFSLIILHLVYWLV